MKKILITLMSAFMALSGGFASAAPSFQERPWKVVPEPLTVTMQSGVCKNPKVLKQGVDKSLGAEGYKMVVVPGGVTITAGDRAGLFYAQQTLEQLKFQYQAEGIPCGTVVDKPLLSWRAIMIDSARHFIPVADVKRFIDVMAFYKFNKLHIHLTDDQGWRLPVPGYPRLETIASKRESTFNNGIPHEGMYTKAELKDIVSYAAAKHIEVIPEIDVPGHNQALCTAYPEFLCFPNPNMKVRVTAGISTTLICPGNPDVWKFYAAVFKELNEIFPSKYVHLGGDEAPEDNWLKCPKCAEFRAKAGIKDPKQPGSSASKEEKDEYRQKMLAAARLEMTELFARLGKMITAQGKRPLYWYENTVDSYIPGSIVYTWRTGGSATPVLNKVNKETGVIHCPHGRCYFDYPQLPGDWPSGQPDTGWMPVNTIQNSYKLDPMEGIAPKDKDRVIGVECCLWSERLPDMDRIFYQAYPRALSISEAGWSPMDVRGWDRFSEKVEFQKTLLESKWKLPMERPEKK